MFKKTINLSNLTRESIEVQQNVHGMLLKYEFTKASGAITDADVFKAVEDINNVRVNVNIRDNNYTQEIFNDIPLDVLCENAMFNNARFKCSYNPQTTTDSVLTMVVIVPFTPHGYIKAIDNRNIEITFAKTGSYSQTFSKHEVKLTTISAPHEAREIWKIERKSLRKGELQTIPAYNKIYMAIPVGDLTTLRAISTSNNEIEMDTDIVEYIDSYTSDDFYEINNKIYGPQVQNYIPLTDIDSLRIEYNKDAFIYLLSTENI